MSKVSVFSGGIPFYDPYRPKVSKQKVYKPQVNFAKPIEYEDDIEQEDLEAVAQQLTEDVEHYESERLRHTDIERTRLLDVPPSEDNTPESIEARETRAINLTLSREFKTLLPPRQPVKLAHLVMPQDDSQLLSVELRGSGRGRVLYINDVKYNGETSKLSSFQLKEILRGLEAATEKTKLDPRASAIHTILKNKTAEFKKDSKLKLPNPTNTGRPTKAQELERYIVKQGARVLTAAEAADELKEAKEAKARDVAFQKQLAKDAGMTLKEYKAHLKSENAIAKVAAIEATKAAGIAKNAARAAAKAENDAMVDKPCIRRHIKVKKPTE